MATGMLARAGRARTMRRNCRPLVIGIRRSRMIASGRTAPATSRPASADKAVATPNPSSFSIRANVSATDRSSSTMRMVRVAASTRWGPAGAITVSFSARTICTSRTGSVGELPASTRFDRPIGKIAGFLQSGFGVLSRPGGKVSPILVRPVREQLEHDRVIRLLQAKLKRKHDVVTNIGEDQTVPVRIGQVQIFPDLVLTSTDKGRKLMCTVEVETAESVNHLEAMAQWAHLGRARAPFHLYVPAGCVDIAKRLASENAVNVAEMWSYHTIGDQTRFTLAHRAPTVEPRRAPEPAQAKPAARPVAKPVTKPVAKSAART